jgi:hypothetical protein
MATIDITDVGPISRLSFPVPAGGGVIVFRGANGTGKSTALEAIDTALSGKGKLAVRDGAERAEVEGFGITLSMRRKLTRSGDLEIDTLEGKLNVADLVDPGFKDPLAADARRIKALVNLSGAKPEPSLFHALLGGGAEFDLTIPPSAIDTDDLVEMAARIKRELEKQARAYEDKAERELLAAQAKRNVDSGLDPSAPSDTAVTQAALEEAVANYSRLKQEQKQADELKAKAIEAQGVLDKARAEAGGPTPAEALANESTKKVASDERLAEVKRLEGLLVTARAEAELARVELSAAINARHAAERREADLGNWQAAIDRAAELKPSDPAALESAAQAVSDARTAVETGALVRAAKARIAEADSHLAESNKHRKRAEKLRDAAAGTDGVLSASVSRVGCSLQVAAGRLVTPTDRGQELYADLSDGERWRLALDIAIDAVGPTGMLVIGQPAWEGLDGINRRAIAAHVRERGALLATAEADEGELRAEVFGEEGIEARG